MKTIVLCGSTRFRAQFRQANYELSRLGFTVLSLSDADPDGNFSEDDKVMFDLVYFNKIAMADAVLLIDGMPTFGTDHSTDPYIGFSTAREILWAQIQGKRVFSLLSATGWGNLADCFTEGLYDSNYWPDHNWIVGHAHHVLRTLAGTDTVKQQIELGQIGVLHAAMSVFACANRFSAINDLAELILRQANLDPMDGDDAEVFLLNIKSDFTTAEMVAETIVGEEMVTLPKRKLIGTLIMLQAIREMGMDPRIGRRRREMVAKLDLTRETLLDSFGLTMDEVIQTRQNNGGMDFPVAEHKHG